MRLWKKLLYVAAGLIILSMLLVAVVVPGLVRNQAVDWVAKNTARQLTLERIGLNPLTWGVQLDGVALSEAGSTDAFVAFDRLSFHVSPRSLFELAPVINDLELVNPHITVIRAADGQFNFADLIPPPDPSAVTPPETPAEPQHFALNNLVIRGGGADFSDLGPLQSHHEIRELEMALPFIGNTPALANRFVKPNLSLRLDDALFAATGEVKPFSEALTSTLQLQIDNIDLPYYSSYLPSERGFTVASGHLGIDVTLAYHINAGNLPELQLKGDIAVTGLRLRDKAGADLIFLPLTQLHINDADLFAGRIALGDLYLNKPELFVARDKNGELNLLQLLPPAQNSTTATPVPTQAEEADPLAISLEQLRLRDGRVHISDASGKIPFERELRTINFQLGRFALPGKDATSYALDFKISDPAVTTPGTVDLKGDFTLEPLKTSAKLKTDRIPLHGLEAYLPPEVSAQILDGQIDCELALDFDGSGSSPQITVNGAAGLRALQIREPVTQSDVLGWESLQLTGLDLQLENGTPRLRLSEVVLNGFLAKILITPEGKINLQQVHTTAKAETAAPAPTASTPTPVLATSAPAPPPDIRIDAVVLQAGNVSFIDQHLKHTYDTRLSDLGGRISHLDARATEPASLDLRARLNNISPLRISGSLNPFGEGLFADIKVRFDAIDLSPMTPYSGTYLGYVIEKGKLSLDLDYRIDGSTLQAGNRVFVDQFTFGDQVDSDQATVLPVRLAVALLKDRKGEIHLNLPVNGSLDDPQFSVVGVIFDILKNLLIKAATSPFALLASLVGGAEDFDGIAFTAGHSDLDPVEQAKLDSLVAALIERPGLKLDVSGYVDPERDPEGWRRAELERRIQRAAKTTGPLSTKQRSRALAQVYDQASIPKPRNVIGMVKTIPDAEMEKLLLAHTDAGDKEMQDLAQERAKTVASYLVGDGKLPTERVFLKQDDINRKPEEGKVASRVGFGIGAN